LDNIPLEDQLVIDELVDFWQTHSEPLNLFEHARSTIRHRCNSLTFFLLTVRDDLRTDKCSKYPASSGSEFRQFLESEYCRLYQPCKERQQAEAQARTEKEKKVRADIDAAARVIVIATTPTEPVELGPKRKRYENICWRCHTPVTSDNNKRCRDCGWFICSYCESCKKDCPRNDEAAYPFLPDFPDDF
jgi:hypothetical protein